MFNSEEREKALARLASERQRIELVEAFIREADDEAFALLQRATGDGSDPRVGGEATRELPSSTERGALEAAVRSVLPRIHGPFNAQQIATHLASNNFEFGSENPSRSVANVLRRLRNNSELRELTPGSGRSPATYALAPGLFRGGGAET